MAQLTDHNVVGTFPDMEAARAALKDLNDTGIDSNQISLLGRQAQTMTGDPDTRLRDLESTKDLAQKSAKTAALGSAVGGLAGAAAFLIPAVGPVIGTGIFAAAAGGAIAGGVVGGMVGAIDATELGPEWEVTYGTPLRAGKVLVAVHARSEQDASRSTKALSKAGADRIDVLDAEGKQLDPAQSRESA